ncbi:MAG: FliM/FliN family flagellar motor switch protein [Pseudomonadota bacterium]
MKHDTRARLKSPTLKPPKISKETAALWTSIAARDLTTKMHLGARDYTLSSRPMPLGKRGKGTAFQVSVGTRPIMLNFSFDLFDECPELLQAEQRKGLGPEGLALTLEHKLTELIDHLERVWQSDLALIAVEQKIPFFTNDTQLCFEVAQGQRACGLAFLTDAPGGEITQALIANAPPREPRPMRQKTVHTVIIREMFAQPQSQVAALKRGDVLFPPDPSAAGAELWHLLVADTHLVGLQQVEDGFVLNGPEEIFQNRKTRISQEYEMSFLDGEKAGSLADPTMVVTIEMARKKTPVSTLESLQAGAVLPLNVAKLETVQICADGEPIADGRLVELDGTIGVQITKLI